MPGRAILSSIAARSHNCNGTNPHIEHEFKVAVVQPLDNGGLLLGGLFHRASQFKFILPLLPLLFVTAGSFALSTEVQTKSGTIVVVGASKNKTVVAADSGVEHDVGGYDDYGARSSRF